MSLAGLERSFGGTTIVPGVLTDERPLELYYELLDVIGEGSFGIVYRARCLRSGSFQNEILPFECPQFARHLPVYGRLRVVSVDCKTLPLAFMLATGGWFANFPTSQNYLFALALSLFYLSTDSVVI